LSKNCGFRGPTHRCQANYREARQIARDFRCQRAQDASGADLRILHGLTMVREPQPGKPVLKRADRTSRTSKGRSTRGRTFKLSPKNPMLILCWRGGRLAGSEEGQVYSDQAYPAQHFFTEREPGRFEVRLPKNHFNRRPVQKEAETQLGRECFWKPSPTAMVRLPKVLPRAILE
jgi:hypothetical protein